VHETVQATMRIHDVGSGTQHKVEGVAKDDLRTEAFQFLGRHRLYGAVRAYRHECGRLNYAVRQCQAAQASSAVS
jgi:hypothetical protein